jgi:hypothetical protein
VQECRLVCGLAYQVDIPALMASVCHMGGRAVEQSSRKAGGHAGGWVDGRDAGGQSRRREGESEGERILILDLPCDPSSHSLV